MVKNKLDFIPQLDSFRFFAVALVIISHWLPNSRLNTIPNGFLGVTFFFVLSGFLISSNLLLSKRSIDAKRLSLIQAIKTFYVRRSLRIFPLYFLVIFLIYLFVPAVFDGKLAWYVAYIPNFLIFKLQEWPGMLSHFWSLGVEEQFYFIWPFLILLTPWRLLKFLFLLVIVISLSFKFFYFRSSATFFNFYDALPISCFDAFAIGSLLAYLNLSGISERLKNFSYLHFWFSFFASVLLCWLFYYKGLSYLFGLAVSISSALLILQTIRGYRGILKIVLGSSFIQYLGKISYGLYIYHNFIPWLVRCIKGSEPRYPLSIPTLNMNWIKGGFQLFILQLLILIIIASLSWVLIERPINNLKKHFV